MKYNEMVFDEDKLVTELLSGQINWQLLSKSAEWTEEDVKKYYNNIVWEDFLSNRKMHEFLNSNNHILDKALEDKLINLNEGMNRYWIETKLARSKNFIIKWCENKSLNYKTIASNKCYNKHDKLKPTEVTKLIKLPKIGEGATLCVGSDRYPYEIVWINKTGTKIKVREMTTETADDFDYYSNQNYIYKSNLNAAVEKATINLMGNYKLNGMILKIGSANKYSDPCF